MDYRAAGAAAYLGLGAVWAMGLSSSAAQLQANPASMPPGLVEITGVLPFTQTIFLWQSIALTAVLIVVSLAGGCWTAPRGASARSAREFIDTEQAATARRLPPRTPAGRMAGVQPGADAAAVAARLRLAVLANSRASPRSAPSPSLNTYNFLFLSLGLLLHWRPRSFLDAVAKRRAEHDRRADAVPAVRRHRDDPDRMLPATAARPWPIACRTCSCRSPRPTASRW